MKPFFVYILRSSDGTFYTGHTDDLERRITQHQSGSGSLYTASRRPLTLAWSQEFATRIEALEAERQIKKWSATKKRALIAGDWDLVSKAAKKKL